MPTPQTDNTVSRTLLLRTRTAQFVLLSILTLLLRVPGLFWGDLTTDGENIYHYDEHQHVEIATDLIHRFDPEFLVGHDPGKVFMFNTRAFGTQIALFGYPVMKIIGGDSRVLLYTGRVLSAVYSVLLVFLVWFLAFRIFRSERVAFLSSLLLALFDLNITYGHFCLPEIAYIFFVYLFVHTLLKFYRCMPSSKDKNSWTINYKILVLLAFSSSAVVALKYDVLPLVVLLGVVIALLKKGHLQFKGLFNPFMVFITLLLLFFQVLNGFNFSLEQVIHSVRFLATDNNNIIASNHHFLFNPITLTFVVLGGTSLPVFLLSASSCVRLASRWRRHRGTIENDLLLILVALLAGEFIILWNMDSIFLRRALIFLPFVAMTGAWGLTCIADKIRESWPHLAAVPAGLVVAWTLGLSLVSQSNFVFETRDQARNYLEEQGLTRTRIGYSRYANASIMPPGEVLRNADCDVIVIHESHYGRFWKNITSPFRIPQSCSEAYHCENNELSLIQPLLKGTSDFTELASFQTLEVFPERLLYKSLFGSFVTGDVRIYRRSKI